MPRADDNTLSVFQNGLPGNADERCAYFLNAQQICEAGSLGLLGCVAQPYKHEQAVLLLTMAKQVITRKEPVIEMPLVDFSNTDPASWIFKYSRAMATLDARALAVFGADSTNTRLLANIPKNAMEAISAYVRQSRAISPTGGYTCN